jgi:hypothetical protein
MPSTRNPRHSPSIAFRVPGEVYVRVDAIAAHLGLSRSDWCRLALGFADSTATLGELAEIERTVEQADARDAVQANLRALARRMRPRAMPGPADAAIFNFN